MHKHNQLFINTVFVMAVGILGLGVYLVYLNDRESATQNDIPNQVVDNVVEQEINQAVASDINLATPEISAFIKGISTLNETSNVTLSVELSNITMEEIEFSPLIDMFVKADGITYSFNGPGTITAGTIASGTKISGEISVTVPEEYVNQLVLNYQPNNSSSTVSIEL